MIWPAGGADARALIDLAIGLVGIRAVKRRAGALDARALVLAVVVVVAGVVQVPEHRVVAAVHGDSRRHVRVVVAGHPAGPEVPLGVDAVQRGDHVYAQPRLLAHLVAIEGLHADHVRARVRSPGGTDRADRPDALPEHGARAAPVRVLLLKSTAWRLRGRVLGKGSRLPPVDQVGSVVPAGEALIVRGDRDAGHEPASVVAELVAGRGDRGGVERSVPGNHGVAVRIQDRRPVRVSRGRRPADLALRSIPVVGVVRLREDELVSRRGRARGITQVANVAVGSVVCRGRAFGIGHRFTTAL